MSSAESAPSRLASLGQLAAGVAHEINNPLGFIRANLETLGDYNETLITLVTRYRALCLDLAAKTPETRSDLAELEATWEQEDIEFVVEDAPEMLQETLNGADRATELVSALKVFARGNSQGIEAVDLHKCVRGALLMAKNELKYHCEIVQDLGDTTTVDANYGGLSQVFVNILLNAGQSIQEKGTVTIQTGMDEGGAFVSITDDGHGMSPETIAKMFDPFFSTRSEGKGQGLGLSISRETVTEYGGQIHVVSEPGHGTTVKVLFPTR
jgi:signal transduction histidine kinase